MSNSASSTPFQSMPRQEKFTNRKRLVIFGSPRISFTGALLDAVLEELRGRDDIELVATVETSRQPPLAEPSSMLADHATERIEGAG